MAAPVDPNRRAGAVGTIVHGPRERIAGAVYGTIVVLGVLAAGSDSASIDAWELDVLMVATVLVLWVAHVYAHALAASLASGLRLDAAAITSLARREIPIVLAAVGPALVLLLGVFGLVSDAGGGLAGGRRREPHPGDHGIPLRSDRLARPPGDDRGRRREPVARAPHRRAQGRCRALILAGGRGAKLSGA